MRVVLLIELALGAPGILVAAIAIVMRQRRSSDQQRLPTPEHMPAPERADRPVPRRKASDMPGSSPDAGRRDPCADEPAEPERAAQAQVSGVARPGPDRQQSTTGAVTRRDRIASYYDEADRPMADYLEAQGWTQEPGAHHPW